MPRGVSECEWCVHVLQWIGDLSKVYISANDRRRLDRSDTIGHKDDVWINVIVDSPHQDVDSCQYGA